MSSHAVSFRIIFLLGLAVASLSHLRAAAPLTEQECQIFGREFADLCRQKNSIELTKLRNFDALVDNTLNGLDLDEAQRRTSRETCDELFQNLFPETLRLDERRTSYFSGTIIYDNRQCVVIDFARGINCDLCLVAIARSADGKPRWTDIYNVSDAAWESELQRVQVLMRLPKEVLVRQPIPILRYLKVSSALRNSTHLSALDKPDEIVAKRNELLEQIEHYSEKLRSQKPVLRLAAILYAWTFENDKFSAEIEHWKKLYPQDLSANFHAYLGFLQLGDNEGAIHELQELKKKTGTNPYLQFILSSRYYARGNLVEAKKAALAVNMEEIHCDPIFGHWDIQMKISLKEKDYQETVRILGDIANIFQGFSTREMVDKEPDFQEFRQSDEYRRWIARAQPTPH